MGNFGAAFMREGRGNSYWREKASTRHNWITDFPSAEWTGNSSTCLKPNAAMRATNWLLWDVVMRQ